MGWLSDDSCFIQPQRDFVNINMVTVGYLFYDFLIQYFNVAGEATFNKEVLIHHIIGLLGMTFA
jgi:hypothetical protein